MSDTVSTTVNSALTPSTVTTGVTGVTGTSSVFKEMDPLRCYMHGIKFFMFLGIIILLVSMFMSSTSAALDANVSSNDTIYYREADIITRPRQRPCGKCARCRMRGIPESFENTLSTFQSHQGLSFQSIPLTNPNTDDQSNLVFGKADRYVKEIDDYKTVTFDVSANLYVLDGNVYDQNKDNLTQAYKVYLFNNRNASFELGELKRDRDGLYKLKFVSKNLTDLIDYKRIVITYERGSEKMNLLGGSFN